MIPDCLWKRADEIPAIPIDSKRRRFDRIESQIRLLADSAFLMRDYETAASMYRMARDDFKSDR